MSDNILTKPWFMPTVIGLASATGGAIVGFVAGMRVGYSIRVNEEEEYEDIIGRFTETVTVDEAGEEDPQLEFEFDATVEDLQEIDTSNVELVVEEERIVRETRPNDPNPRNDPRDITVDWEAVDRAQKENPEGIYITREQEEARIRRLNGDEPVQSNVFALDYGDWNYDVELVTRSVDKPYILHRDEFWGEEMNYDQSTLTYYVDDDILTSQDDEQPIPRYETVTGPLRFGHGSGDPNVVYIRNDNHSAEYEVLRFEGSYTQEVLGLAAEDESEKSDLKHSVRKFRPRDD
jgi:hypothetical protein